MWELDYKERWTIDAFELWCWRRLLRVSCSARRSNQSILKEISTEYTSEGLMLKLKLQYFSHLMQRADSLEKTLMLGKIEGRRGRGRQRMRWLSGITHSMDMSLSKFGSQWWTGKPGVLQSRGVAKSWTQLSDFTFTFHFHALEKETATHSSILAWRIPGAGEAGRLTMGLHRVGHDWSDSSSSNSSVYVSIPNAQYIPPSLPPWCQYVCSLCLCLYFCFANNVNLFLNSLLEQAINSTVLLWTAVKLLIWDS